MKRIIGIMFLLTSSVSFADHLDVIGFTLDEDCSFSDYMEIVGDFNAWGEERGYQTEIAAPVHHDNMQTYYWIGRSANGETFGKAYDEWVAGLFDEDSGPYALNERFRDCAINDSRRSYLTFP